MFFAEESFIFSLNIMMLLKLASSRAAPSSKACADLDLPSVSESRLLGFAETRLHQFSFHFILPQYIRVQRLQAGP